jgi:hypothetical protein
VIAIGGANAGVKAMFDAINVAYGAKEERGFFKLNAISLAAASRRGQHRLAGRKAKWIAPSRLGIRPNAASLQVGGAPLLNL